MSQYTTGELAKLCGVTVRTVQYYDTRGLLAPSALSEGGRRLYSQQDVRRMQIICFLREAGLPISSITRLLAEDDPGSVIALLLQQQKESVQEELSQCRERLALLEGMERELQRVERFSLDSLGDIACVMEGKKALRRLHRTLVLTGLPVTVLQWAGVLLWILAGRWQLFALHCPLALGYGVWVSRYYFRRVAYICPQCHQVFRPTLKEAFWARHTPTLRRLRCPCCGHKGFCVEIYKEEQHAAH